MGKITIMKKKISYPLLENAFSNNDIRCGLKVLSSKHITMSKITRNFEKNLQKKLDANMLL